MAVGTMIDIGAGLYTAISNKNAVDNTNSTNMQIAQMNNEWSERMMEKQMAYNTEMWEKVADYNSLPNKMQQARDAGVNPYMALSGNAFGSISAPSANSVSLPSPSQVQAQPAQYDFSSVSNSIIAGMDLFQKAQLMKSQQSNIDASTDQLRIENKYHAMKLVSEIAEKMANTKDSQAKAVYQQIINEYAEQGIKTDLEIKNQTLSNMKETFRGLVLENAMTSEQLRFFPEQVRAQLGLTASQILLNQSNSKLSQQKMVESIYNQWKTDSERQGIQINNSILRKAAKDIVDKYYYEKEQIKNNQGPEGGYGIFNIMHHSINDLFDIFGN
nr:unnamed protein product [uncultured bacterium]